MAEPSSRQRRIVKRVVLWTVLVPVLLAAYVGGAIGIAYLDASGIVRIDGPIEKALEISYWPLGFYEGTDLPGADALSDAVRSAREAGRERRLRVGDGDHSG